MKRLCLALVTGSVLAISGLTSCAASPTENYSGSVAVEAEADGALADVSQEAAETTAQSAAPASSPPPSDEAPADQAAGERPQLIKRATLALSVDSVEESFEQVRSIVAAQQGDVLSMDDYGDRQRTIEFSLRVPQARLETTLDELTALGSVRSRGITTDDVSSQLVDLQARINNARKSEEALQEIMSRSGDIADVLEVSRELSNVRQSIEQMSAQQTNLQTQVSYSTITLSLQSEVALSPNKPGFSTQLATSWNEATESVGDFTTDLLQLGLWLLVYSPYLLVLACGLVLAKKARDAARDRRPS